MVVFSGFNGECSNEQENIFQCWCKWLEVPVCWRQRFRHVHIISECCTFPLQCFKKRHVFEWVQVIFPGLSSDLVGFQFHSASRSIRAKTVLGESDKYTVDSSSASDNQMLVQPRYLLWFHCRYESYILEPCTQHAVKYPYEKFDGACN